MGQTVSFALSSPLRTFPTGSPEQLFARVMQHLCQRIKPIQERPGMMTDLVRAADAQYMPARVLLAWLYSRPFVGLYRDADRCLQMLSELYTADPRCDPVVPILLYLSQVGEEVDLDARVPIGVLDDAVYRLQQLVAQYPQDPAYLHVLGTCFSDGVSVDEDMEQAMALWQRAADLGFVLSHESLSWMQALRRATAGASDTAHAPLTERTSRSRVGEALGFSISFFNLGCAYSEAGDLGRSIAMFRRAAALGDLDAANNLVLDLHTHADALAADRVDEDEIVRRADVAEESTAVLRRAVAEARCRGRWFPLLHGFGLHEAYPELLREAAALGMRTAFRVLCDDRAHELQPWQCRALLQAAGRLVPSLLTLAGTQDYLVDALAPSVL